MATPVGKILVRNAVPPDMRDFVDKTVLDKKGIASLFEQLAEKHPDEYPEIVKKLTSLGFEVATREGSTVTLNDLISPIDKKKRFAEFEKTLAGKSKDEKVEAWRNFGDQLNKELVDVGVRDNKSLAKVIASGARGSPDQYRQTIMAPLLVADETGQLNPDNVIRRSYAEGLSLPEYLMTSFQTRKAMIGTKLSVADAGALSKQLSRASMGVQTAMADCGTRNGIEVGTADKDYIGSFLAKPVKSYKYNNEVTAGVMADLRDSKVDSIVVRSPMTCQASKHFSAGSVCQMCLGRRDKGLSPIGDMVGITAASGLGESLAQGMLNSKHGAGRGGVSGFQLINQLTNIPQSFQNKAILSEEDGKVVKIEKAPQGGHNITIAHKDSGGGKNHINGERTYHVREGLGLKVKAGDSVEEGDVLSEGIPNPAEIVAHKGVGEGRKAYSSILHTTFKDSGMGINKRNFDVLAKGAIDHVEVRREVGDYLPGDVVSYSKIEKDYKPRPGSKQVRVDAAKGLYLEEPVLHFTIGTKLTWKMADELRRNGVVSVLAHDRAPDFKPAMQRIVDIPEHSDDWMEVLNSTYLQRRFTDQVNTGAVSNIAGPSPIPGLAYGLGFGARAVNAADAAHKASLTRRTAP